MLSTPGGSVVYFGEVRVHSILEATVVSSAGAVENLLDYSCILLTLTGETPLPTLY